MTPFEKHQLMLEKQRETEAKLLPSKTRVIPWARDVIAKAKYHATAPRPSQLLEEYMQKQAEKQLAQKN